MQKTHIGKILAIGIIVLFIGVGIHPVFAAEIKKIPEKMSYQSKLQVKINGGFSVFGVKVFIKNIGEEDVKIAFVNILIDAPLINSRHTASPSYYETISPGEERISKTGWILGFGPATITVKIFIDINESLICHYTNASGFILGFFVLGINPI